jgi:hypothetical protein
MLLSSFFLINSVLYLSKQDIASLSETKWGYNLDVAKNLSHQRADTVVGFSLLLFAFFLQMFNLCWEMRACDFAINWKGILIALIVSCILWLVANKVSNYFYTKHYTRIEVLLKTP